MKKINGAPTTHGQGGLNVHFNLQDKVGATTHVLLSTVSSSALKSRTRVVLPCALVAHMGVMKLTFLLHDREGIKTAESKNKQLRESFRDQLELAQQNHDNLLKVLQEQLEKLQQSQKEVQKRDQVSRSKVSSRVLQ